MNVNSNMIENMDLYRLEKEREWDRIYLPLLERFGYGMPSVCRLPEVLNRDHEK